MSLAIYDSLKIKIADFANTIVTSHNGTLGEAVDTLLYLRNDDPNHYYEDLTIQFQDSDPSTGNDLLGPGGSGWGVKVSAGSRRPTKREWDAIAWNNIANVGTIGDTALADVSGYYPFYIRVVVPGLTPALVKADISLIVSGSQRLIGT